MDGQVAKTAVNIVKKCWRDVIGRGRCHVLTVRGTYRTVLVVHHGSKRVQPEDIPQSQRAFLRACKTRLRSFKGIKALFQLDRAWVSSYGRVVMDDVRTLKRRAVILADQLPKYRWRALDRLKWVTVLAIQDGVEMWSVRIERSGRLYRVLDGGWGSIDPRAEHFENLRYIGARRGAYRFAGY